MYERLAIPASGGPTSASAPLTPGISWHAAQPYRLIAALPRAGSLPVSTAASRSRA
ncbi:MAG TPA: hypothetical protein VFD58_28110 [Blastocatellia bacterium]|nr:hypothetical protein [Blastocatellia bacterium]